MGLLGDEECSALRDSSTHATNSDNLWKKERNSYETMTQKKKKNAEKKSEKATNVCTPRHIDQLPFQK